MEDIVNLRFEENRKRQGLPLDEPQGEDRSRKGSVDGRILPLVSLINATKEFFTTSTCSGRLILFTNETVEAEEHPAGPSGSGTGSASDTSISVPVKKIKKKGCNWLLVSHDEVEVSKLLQAWTEACDGNVGEVSFKMEAAIVHVQCRSLSDAKKLIHTATESGFRNSGMVVGKENRITVAIRSTIGVEVPLHASSSDGASLIPEAYLEYLLRKGNEKLVENWRRLDKLTQEFQKTFSPPSNA